MVERLRLLVAMGQLLQLQLKIRSPQTLPIGQFPTALMDGHVIIPRDLQLRGWWLMQTPEAALVFQEVFLPLNLFKGRLFQTLVVPPKTMKTVLAAIQIHP